MVLVAGGENLFTVQLLPLFLFDFVQVATNIPDGFPHEGQILQRLFVEIELLEVHNIGVQQGLQLLVVRRLFVQVFLFVGELVEQLLRLSECQLMVEERRSVDVTAELIDLTLEGFQISNDERRFFLQRRAESLLRLHHFGLQILPARDDRLVFLVENQFVFIGRRVDLQQG